MNVGKILFWGGALAVVGLVASSGDDAGGGGSGGGDNKPTGNASFRQQVLRAKLLSIAELTPVQRIFLEITAGGETGQHYTTTAHNGSASEVAASVQAAANNPAVVARAVACGIPRSRLETGSWGLFQRLAPFLSGDAFEIFGDAGCGFADPTNTGIDFQIASAIETAHDLGGYNGFKAHPTVGNLRLGWAAPALMGYLSNNADRIARYRKQARETGYDESVIDLPISRFPSNVAAIFQRLVSVA